MNRFAQLPIAIIFASSAPAAPSPDLDGFRGTVLPFLENYCFDCHNSETQKGKLSLEGIEPDIIGGEQLETWRLVRDQLHFHDMPPAKKAQPGKPERTAVLAWLRGEFLKSQEPDSISVEKLSLPQFGNYVDHQALFDQRRARVDPAPPRVWRLRPDIYDSVVPRLGEGVSGLANALSYADGPVIKDFAGEYFIDEASTSPLLGNAKKVAAALVGPKSKDRVFKQLVDENVTPSDELVQSAIAHAFRKVLGRDPTGSEAARFLTFYKKAHKTGGTATAGTALLTAVLMQPEFLFRCELGDGQPDQFGRVRLTQREIAYALSYALDDQPVAAFLDAAGDGRLADADEIETLLREHLQDDSKAYDKNPRLMQFFREYFDYPNATEIFKDQPEGGQHEPEWLVADLEMTIADILREDREVLKTLLTTRRFYVNATFGSKKKSNSLVRRNEKRGKYETTFNLPPDWRWSAEQQPLEFRKDERAGVLTHPAWLAAWSGNFDNHPVQRGKWVRTHLLAGSVPNVPIGVDARVPELEHKSFRDRLAMATSAAECWRCHRSMDPLGVAFERYDHYGRFQRLDVGQPVDASAEVSRTMFPELHRKFSGPTEMMEFLGNSERVEQVFVRYAFRYFMGRNETLGDANTLQDAYKAYRGNEGSFNALVVSLLSSDSFLLRRTKALSD